MSNENEERLKIERLKEEARQAKEAAKDAAEKAKQEANEERLAKEEQLKEEARQAREAADRAKQEALKTMENSVLGTVFGKSRNESEQKALDQHEKGKTTNRIANCIIAVILLAVVGSCFGGGKDKTQTPKQETAQTQQTKQEQNKQEVAQAGTDNQDPIMKILNGEPTEQEKRDQEKALRDEAEKKAKEEQAKQQGEQRARAWCSNMRILMDDTDEQWAYWWPIATGSHDIATGYDAANTLNLNLKQYLDSFNGSKYEIPLNATEAQKSQMKEIKKKFSDSLWKRIKASEKYSKALRSGNFDLKEAEGIRRRANESDSTATQASLLLRTLETSLGMEP